MRKSQGRKAGRGVSAALLACLCLSLAPPSFADNSTVVSIARRMREQGMTQWRNGDFLGAYGNCYGARQMILRLKGLPPDVAAGNLGYAEICMGLALYQMNLKSRNHDPCKLLIQAQKNFMLVDKLRRARGQTPEDNGYLAEMMKDRRCRS